MPTYSHTHMLALLTKFISDSGHLIVPTGYYLPGLYHMLSTCYYSAADNFTDTRSSAVPELCHILKYIICKHFMYFASSNIE